MQLQHTTACVCVCSLLNMHSLWDLCIRCGFTGEFWMRSTAIFNLHKQRASADVNDFTFGRVICHSVGGWSVKAIDCKLTGEIPRHKSVLHEVTRDSKTPSEVFCVADGLQYGTASQYFNYQCWRCWLKYMNCPAEMLFSRSWVAIQAILLCLSSSCSLVSW